MGSSSSSEISGVRVFKVSPASPAAEAGLEVFFDFIVEINGVVLDPRCQNVFAEKIAESENKPMGMIVYNSRVHATREVVITPRKWAGTGLLGATVRYDTCDSSEAQGIRVLEVFPNSPAAHAGLVPFQDFLLGTKQAAFRDIEELVEAVNVSINKRLEVAVYNTDSETVRDVVLVPNNDWGGEGCIGCDIGSGLLHRIPVPRRKPVGAAPGQMPAAPAAPTVPIATPGVPTAAAGVAGPAAVPNLPSVPPPSVPAGAPAPATPGVPPMPSVPGVPAAMPGAPAVLPGTNGYSGAPMDPGSLYPPPPLAQIPQPSVPQLPIPQPGTPQQEGLFPASPVTPGGVELPRAPPSTPMDDSKVPPPVDLSSAMAQAQAFAQATGN